MAFDWDTSAPADDGVISQFPTNERDFRTAARGAFNVDHLADTTGYHRYVTMNDPGSEPTFAALHLGLYQRAGVLKSKLASGTAKQIPQFTTGSSGDTVLFMQAAAPTGWTQNTSVTDKVLRITDSTGAGTGGTWTISGLTADAHTHTKGTLAGSTDGAGGTTGAGSGGGTYYASVGHTHNVTLNAGTTSTASANGVTHTPGWRPAYVDVIACYMTT